MHYLANISQERTALASYMCYKKMLDPNYKIWLGHHLYSNVCSVSLFQFSMVADQIVACTVDESSDSCSQLRGSFSLSTGLFSVYGTRKLLIMLN